MRSTPRELPPEWDFNYSDRAGDWKKSVNKIKSEIDYLENPQNKKKNPQRLALLKEMLSDLYEKDVYSDYIYEWTMP